MSAEPCIQLFSELGLSRLEAEIYVFLVQHSPATGYKISKGIGRSRTNTYKALAALEAKGAILVEDGDSRRCRAVPPDELLDQFARRFQARRERAAQAARALPGPPDDQRVYQLHTVDQVYERSRRMLRSCEGVAFLDLFPEPLVHLHEEIEEAARRGMNLAVQVYEPVKIKGVRLILNRTSADILRRLAVQWMSLFVDGKQHLLALLAPGGREVHQATWSASPILSWSYFSYADSDFLLSSLAPLLESGASLADLRRVYRSWKKAFPEGSEAGYRLLIERFNSPTLPTDPLSPLA